MIDQRSSLNFLTPRVAILLFTVLLVACSGGSKDSASSPQSQPAALSAGNLALGAATYSVAQTSGALAVTVARSGGSSGAVNVSYSTANGTAVAGTDYVSSMGTLSWADGDSAPKTVSISISNATAFSGTKTFSIALSNVSGGVALSTPSSAIVTINGSAASTSVTAGSLAFSPAAYTTAQTGTAVTMTVIRTGGSSGPVSVAYGTQDGSAIAGTNYTGTQSTLSWVDGDTSAKTFSVPVNASPAFSGNKTFSVALSAATGGATVGSPASATITITGSAVATASGTLSFTSTSYSAQQTAGTVIATVNRTAGSSGAVTVHYATQNGTAIAGTNYTATSGDLSWAAGVTTAKTIAIPVNTSPSFSGSKTLTLALSLPSGGAVLGTPASATISIVGSTASTLSVRAQGNHLIDAQGNTLQLRGVNVSGLEFVAVQGGSAADPFGGQKPNWNAIKAWKANAVRLPLNQASWLGQTCADPVTGVNRSADPGGNYVATVTQAVNEATAAGFYVILDLHMSAPGSYCPGKQNIMADETNSIPFWTSLAQAFKNQPNVMFELFNEPFVTQALPWFTGDGWQYLMKGTGGGPFTGIVELGQIEFSFTWKIASMQAMLDAVRATGATNVVLVAGLYYAQAFDGWLANRPTDPLSQMAAVWHPYPEFNSTFGTPAGSQPHNAPLIFTQAQAILDAGIPIVMTEMGDQCSDGTPNSPQVTNMLTWADARNVSALGWTWNAWGHGAGCSDILIKDATGTPTDGYGQVFHDWLVNHP